MRIFFPQKSAVAEMDTYLKHAVLNCVLTEAKKLADSRSNSFRIASDPMGPTDAKMRRPIPEEDR